MNEIFNCEIYSPEDISILETYIEKSFGKFDNVLHEIVSPDIHVDICIINPTPERDFYTLVTMGMGAHSMNTPPELKDQNRAELCIYLPSDWKINDSDEQWYWPLRWLKILARLPMNNDTWLGHYHTIPSGDVLADNTSLCGFILEEADFANGESSLCKLENDDIVNFYALIPLYEEEMSYKVDNNGETLMERLEELEDFSLVVDIHRESAVDEYEVLEGVVDSAHFHTEAIYEKNLQIDEMSALNHIAIYLRWFIEKDMVHEKFIEYYPDVVANVKENKPDFDMRIFLHTVFNGRLFIYLFNDEGANFTAYYYSGDDGLPHYPQDVDSYAVDYFGGEPPEMQEEEYLFLPYDETYYEAMKKYINEAYESYLKEVE